MSVSVKGNKQYNCKKYGGYVRMRGKRSAKRGRFGVVDLYSASARTQ
jgi:hypothetical protein